MTATGPTSASEGVRTPPVRITCEIGPTLAVQHVRRPGSSSSRPSGPERRAGGARGARSSCPPVSPIAWPGSTSAAAARAIASFSVSWRCDFASNPGSSALQADPERWHRRAPCRRGRPTASDVEVAADGHIRDGEQLGQLADAHRATAAELLEDQLLALSGEHDRSGTILNTYRTRPDQAQIRFAEVA